MQSESPSIDLNGLPISSPIGFMAALGLLRVCVQDHGLPVQLSWTDMHARLHGIARGDLTALLRLHMRDRALAPEFNFKVTGAKGSQGPVQHLREIRPQDFRDAAVEFRGSQRALDFLAGFATDAVVNDKGFVARTRLDFTSGQQRIAEEFRRIALQLSAQSSKANQARLERRIDSALFGGPYETQTTLGWDPSALMTHAHQPKAPTDSETPGQPMMVWLAVESLALHPVLPNTLTKAATTGFDGGGAYVWPQWHEPLSLGEVRLLRLRPIGSLTDLPGIDAVWSSKVGTNGKFGILRPAARITSDRMPTEGFAQPVRQDGS